MKRARVVVPIAALGLFLLGGWSVRNKLAADRQGEWIRVTRGDLVTGVEVTGKLAAIETDSLGPPQIPDMWDFKISMMAPEGGDVKKGQPVLGFDSSELQRRLDEYRALAEQARKEIEKRRADLALKREDERLQLAEAEGRMRRASMKLEAPPDITGIKDRKQVELDYGVAKREVRAIGSQLTSMENAAAAEIRLLQSKQQQAQAVVTTTESAIRQMTVPAPRDGTIVYIQDWRGEKHKVGDTCWKALRVIEIPDMRRMKANGEVDEADAGKITIGQRVTFRLDAHPDDEFHGTITSAARTVQQQSGTKDPLKVLRVDISVDRTDPAKMRPGMRFQGTVELARAKDAVVIPRTAIFMTERGPVVYRRTLLGVAAVPVRLGRENDKLVEVVKGIGPDDRVLLQKSGEDKSPGEKS